MKSARMIALSLAAVIPMLTVFPAIVLAADAARVAGDLKVDGLYFSGDSNHTLIRKPSDFSAPWTISNLDIYYFVLGGKVGIGTNAPSAALDVTGTVNATQFSGNGAGLTNVTASSVADGSITDAKIGGIISAAKVDLSTVQKKFGKVVFVAASGGDYTNPASAMGDYATWCGTPSPTNTCLLKIMPGTYTIGAGSVQMQSYIDIEGSGENSTIITGNLDSATAGTINGAANTELRFITVKNTGGGTSAMAVYSTGASVKMTNVTATASGSTNNYGIVNASSTVRMLDVTATATGGSNAYGILNQTSSTATLINVTATASGGSLTTRGVYNHTSSATLFNVTATGTGGSTFGVGINNYTGGTLCTVRIDNSKVKGSTYSVAGIVNFTTLVSNTEFGGGITSGPITCAGVYNSSYAFFASSCP